MKQLTFFLLFTFSISIIWGQDIPITKDNIGLEKKKTYSPYADRNFPTRVFWGDSHLHTSLSLDARAAGVILDPNDALRFARGEEVTASQGMRVKLSRPLDWLVVTDHSDAMGAMNKIVDGDPMLMADPQLKDWHTRLKKGGQSQVEATVEIITTFSRGNTPEILLDRRFQKTIWDEYLEATKKYNEPGRFSAIIGYEWTSTVDGNNLHRNILFRDNEDQAAQVLPYTTAESSNPEDLWKWMQAYEDKTGGSVLAIAHNGNLSNGLMFPDINPVTGKQLTSAYAQTRARWEPVYEVTQIKGDGETHPFLSTNDEFADYETWDWGNLGEFPKKEEMLQYEYMREALKNGLKHEDRIGTNPFKFGVVGATDSHTALATGEEDNFWGKVSVEEPNEHRAIEPLAKFGDIVWEGWAQVQAGYGAVWATENTREAIFDAMKRREVYATTGPRMIVRFFGGWDFNQADTKLRLPADAGYAKGVPMGGDLTNAPEGRSPSFLVAARKDPYSGNLDRIQIIKGWLDKDGKTHEKVYDVVWSGDRKVNRAGKVPAVGNTVDIKNATWTNTIGAPELITVWTDPDFDPNERAFYYTRVIEIPTPRWTAYDAKYFETVLADEVPMTTQERAYTSPIWYTP